MTSTRAGSRSLVPVGYGRYTVSIGDGSWFVRRRSVHVAIAALGAILVLGVLSLGLGTYALTPAEVLRVLAGGGEGIDRTVVLEWRLPRTVAAIVLGGFLAVAGALFQTVTRNPLASPDVIGLSNGAFTGMLVTVVFVSGSWPALTLGAVLGGLAAAAAIWLLASRDGVQGFRLIVVGIGVSALLASVNTWLLLQVELETAMFASAWGAGTLNGLTATPVLAAILTGLPLLAVLIVLAARLRILDLGDDAATAVGVNAGRVRTWALLIGVLLVSISTAVIGPVAFIALAAPQIARRAARSPSLSVTLSALFGGGLLLASDLVAQHALPVSLPTGVVTVSVGGLYLVTVIVLEIRRRA
ncbi:iron complex transport system permease protein [Labedella gwakjiensis]|uniref:Iron complex transport system permease protein n=1 Tax=Labedella gwakjiensis TaxID=390269 RepID=A0A2P8GYV7_9MICO|nr:iron chelate uptake ABC transporter family permease subunit [Labedella gwakjiensis]PSL39142.1 iron complex transport system permease protein [Labedella gwakjiensis]RUQ86420.1 iron-enterobactin ABC transporter permease [Labedella gwakjiensis]